MTKRNPSCNDFGVENLKSGAASEDLPYLAENFLMRSGAMDAGLENFKSSQDMKNGLPMLTGRLLRQLGPVDRHGGPLRSWTSSKGQREWSTPLAKDLAEAITTTGPIPIAAYMRQCLISMDGGYYTAQRDPFGKSGDFVTAPEISQIFGELLGVWLMTEWMAQGKRGRGVELVELGPGRGTLMDDVLRTIRNYKPLASSIDGIHLVEASSTLREAQKQLLCGDALMEETEKGYRSTSKYLGLPVMWTESLRAVPEGQDKSPFIFAHEFFDALPINAFQSVVPPPSASSSTTMTPTGPVKSHLATKKESPVWRELLVSTKRNFDGKPSGDEEFFLALAKASTPNSLVMPQISERYKALKSTPGSTIEISPESLSYVQEIARRVGGPNPKKGSQSIRRSAGAAMIIDYGTSSTIPINSLRGIRNHRQVSPFSSPGLADLSADVDFTALAEAALNASPCVEVYGPVEQGNFLQTLGITERAEHLLQASQDHEKKTVLQSATKRLVERGDGGMGRIYKAMAIVPESGGKRRPVGFGGSVPGW